jgi:hypothetical protein
LVARQRKNAGDWDSVEIQITEMWIGASLPDRMAVDENPILPNRYVEARVVVLPNSSPV